MPRHVERRLTTILAADIAEYSRLMRADEDATLRGLTACRAIVEALVAEHRGRIANTAGDALLMEFPSAVDGLVCAIAIQRAIAKQNEDFPPERRMLFRIGVHCGDVIPRDGDLFGVLYYGGVGYGKQREELPCCSTTWAGMSLVWRTVK